MGTKAATRATSLNISRSPQPNLPQHSFLYFDDNDCDYCDDDDEHHDNCDDDGFWVSKAESIVIMM